MNKQMELVARIKNMGIKNGTALGRLVGITNKTATRFLNCDPNKPTNNSTVRLIELYLEKVEREKEQFKN
jgi:hypothetical protein